MYSTRYYSQILKELNFFDWFWENPQISNFLKIRPFGAECFHADKRKDERHEKTDVAFRNVKYYKCDDMEREKRNKSYLVLAVWLLDFLRIYL
jgi:hypothetical protein